MKLASVIANIHVFEGTRKGKPLRLLLTFENGQTIRLGVAGDGYRMLVDDQLLDEPFDMGDVGSVAVADMTHLFDARLQSAELREARELELDGQCVGVEFPLAGGTTFHFWVDGDELFWGDEEALAAHHWLDGLVPTPAGPVHV